MPNSKKKRDKVEYDGKASSRKRKEAQDQQASINIDLRLNKEYGKYPDETPWQTQKAKRLAKRIANGKTPENWARSNAKKQPKANVSNLSTNV